MRENQLAYLNGFLDAVATSNSFINDSKTYYAALLEKDDGADLQQALRTHLGVRHWLINSEPISADWKAVLAAELRPYFGQLAAEVGRTLAPESLAEVLAELVHNPDLPIGLLLQTFISELAELVPTAAVFRRVKVDYHPADAPYEGFYECYAADYVFDAPAHLLFLHFGGSD